MTVKEKAKDLVERYKEVFAPIGNSQKYSLIKECALICLYEMKRDYIKQFEIAFEGYINIVNEAKESETYKYYEELEKEIQKL